MWYGEMNKEDKDQFFTQLHGKDEESSSSSDDEGGDDPCKIKTFKIFKNDKVTMTPIENVNVENVTVDWPMGTEMHLDRPRSKTVVYDKKMCEEETILRCKNCKCFFSPHIASYKKYWDQFNHSGLHSLIVKKNCLECSKLLVEMAKIKDIIQERIKMGDDIFLKLIHHDGLEEQYAKRKPSFTKDKK